MYALVESLRSALYAIRAHKLRSFLTTLGIIIGVMAVVTIVSLIQGFSQSISSEFAGFGTDSLTITSYLPFKEQLEGKVARVTPDDMLAIQHQVPGISGVTPMRFGRFLPRCAKMPIFGQSFRPRGWRAPLTISSSVTRSNT